MRSSLPVVPLLALFATAMLVSQTAAVQSFMATETPALQVATNAPWVELDNLTARGDGALDQMRAKGMLYGSGTLEDPYILAHKHVKGDLEIKDTNKPIIIAYNKIDGKLKLNYNGPHVAVFENEIHDLRVNENVHRTALTTGGNIYANNIGQVGQLRHWSGTFANNTVGPKPAMADNGYMGDDGHEKMDDPVVFNLDGYHRGKVLNNTIYGPVKAKLHGHFHGSCYECPHHEHRADSHGHSHTSANEHRHDDGIDHTDRWHSVTLAGNRIEIDEELDWNWALAVNDWGHQ
ncbi:MAG: hypothetical protein R3185_09495, partial [Candidatus Thermoplasmatota archaeon]|nr:hypothetical protein [Candidatus Thermoplasmatota archaeon]